jgi:CheY-like chemotaxis protein/AraC-like DNA-binding protein
VSVRLEAAQDEFILSVADDGPGIPEGTGDTLFQKFYQAPKQGKRPEKGFGIGLYLAKSLANLHGASLSYQCPVSGGTVFTFTLAKGTPENAGLALRPEVEKAMDSDITLPAVTDRKLSELVSEKKVMLIVENDPQMTAYLRHLFKALTVYDAQSAAEGWNKVQEVSPDIILCDILMDESSGIEFCRKLKTGGAHGHVPVILLTGCSSGEVRREGIECGADDYIVKPFESELLVARVNNILKDREVLKKYFFNEITLQSNSLRVSDEFKGFLADCIRVVEENIERDDFDSNAFAKKMGMSRSKLYTRVKSISGLSVNEFVKLIRLRRAAELMIHTDGQVKEISFQVGFSDGKYFREQFTRLFELKPSDYIARYRKNFQANAHLSDQFNKIKPR